MTKLIAMIAVLGFSGAVFAEEHKGAAAAPVAAPATEMPAHDAAPAHAGKKEHKKKKKEKAAPATEAAPAPTN